MTSAGRRRELERRDATPGSLSTREGRASESEMRQREEGLLRFSGFNFITFAVTIHRCLPSLRRLRRAARRPRLHASACARAHSRPCCDALL